MNNREVLYIRPECGRVICPESCKHWDENRNLNSVHEGWEKDQLYSVEYIQGRDYVTEIRTEWKD